MDTIFDTVLNSRTGLGDVGVSFDPFTGATSAFIPAVVRYPGGPVMSRHSFYESVREQIIRREFDGQVPRELRNVEDTFNCGVAHFDGSYVMLVRFQNAARFNHVFLARSADGIRWNCRPELLKLPDLPPAPDPTGIAASGYEVAPGKAWRTGVVYDPRITQMEDDSYLITLAVDYDTLESPGEPYINICDSVLYRTRNFREFEFVSAISGHTRNCVIFPRQMDGYYYAAGRPNAAKRVHTMLMRSKDLRRWEPESELFAGGHAWTIYAGPAFPPFETEDYWIFGMHGVETHGTFQVVYRAGICLLEKNTLQVVAPPIPLLHPEQQYEQDGTVNNVIFPTGLLFGDGCAYGVKQRDVKLAIYYGAADSTVGVALTTVGRLIDAALGEYNPLKTVRPIAP